MKFHVISTIAFGNLYDSSRKQKCLTWEQISVIQYIPGFKEFFLCKLQVNNHNVSCKRQFSPCCIFSDSVASSNYYTQLFWTVASGSRFLILVSGLEAIIQFPRPTKNIKQFRSPTPLPPQANCLYLMGLWPSKQLDIRSTTSKKMQTNFSFSFCGCPMSRKYIIRSALNINKKASLPPYFKVVLCPTLYMCSLGQVSIT